VRAEGEYEIPVSLLDARHGVDDALAKLRVGERQIALCHFDAPPVLVGLQPAQQRLREGEVERSRELRVERRELIVGFEPRRVEGQIVRAARPRDESAHLSIARDAVLGELAIRPAAKKRGYGLSYSLVE
jgi:hypothetical protein